MKDRLRAEARARLRAMSEAERATAGAAIATAVWRLPPVAGARSLLVYAALPSEVPTDAIVAEAEARGITPVYPRCLPETRELALHRLGPGEGLVVGAYGIREPAATCPIVSLEEVDAALVPGLGWDRRGHRLGRGAGYYDRLLADARWRGFACGLFFDAQEFEDLPRDAWDVALDAIVTERGRVRKG